METLTEDHIKSLLSEEWLVKVDGQKSVPYLIKFHHSTMDLSCIVLVSDTKSVWTEVLDAQQFARRWRLCNPNAPLPYANRPDEDSWRESTLELLSNAHTLGAITDISFEVVESNFSDFAFELESEHFKWRWETNFIGHRQSAEIISKQLILPLICLNHISLSSPDALSGMSDGDVEQAVDKVGRTARRALDNHVKVALAKPRTSTILRRITAMFNFIPNLPPVFSTAEKPDLEPKVVGPRPNIISDSSNSNYNKSNRFNAPAQNVPVQVAPERTPTPPASTTRPQAPTSKAKAPENSETEDDDDDENENEGGNEPPKKKSHLSPEPGGEDYPVTYEIIKKPQRDSVMRSPSPSPPPAPGASNSNSNPSSSAQRSGSGPASSKPPSAAAANKKPRLAAVSSSSSSDGDDDGKRGQSKTVKRGARQPVKRGGKRF